MWLGVGLVVSKAGSCGSSDTVLSILLQWILSVVFPQTSKWDLGRLLTRQRCPLH